MIVIPIISGRAYRVTERGVSFDVIAPDGCMAVIIAGEHFFARVKGTPAADDLAAAMCDALAGEAPCAA